MPATTRAAVYLRVSTDGQTTDNQRLALREAAERRGWTIVGEYQDQGISGAKGRDKRPGLDRMLKDATRGKFDVVMAWAVDRLGRSLPDLVMMLQDLHGAKVDLYLHQQALDTTTPAGKAMFGMLGVFAEFERSMIQERVKAGISRARARGVKLGRPKLKNDRLANVRNAIMAGQSLRKVAVETGVSYGTCASIRNELKASGLLTAPSQTAPGPTAPGPTAPA